MLFTRFGAALGVLLLLSSCGTDGGTGANNGDGSNNGGKGDNASGWLAEQLADRGDSIAQFLRTRPELDEEGVAELSYQDLQFGIAEIQGCSVDSARNFIISDDLIEGAEAFPRLVGTVCTDDESKNWMTFFSPPEASGDRDLEVRTVEMFSWDADAREYRFYRTDPVDEESTEVRVAVGPSACSDCHLARVGLDATHQPMNPIMNELTQPWEHWNAEPGFESQHFHVPEDVLGKPNYDALTGGNWKASARDLELMVRKGHQKVAETRIRRRRDPAPASLSVTMSLLRPLFCDEQVNYISEAGTSGQLLLNSVTDYGLRDLIKKVQPTGWGQKWMDPEAKLRMPAPAAGDRTVQIMPVRGNAMETYENQFASAARGIDVETAIQIRLLDWSNPVFSQQRCDLWEDANERYQRSIPESIGSLEGRRNYEILPAVVAEILQVEGVSLQTGEPGRYYMLQNGADLGALASAVSEGAVAEASCDGSGCSCPGGVCVADLNGVVDVIEGNLRTFEELPDLRARMLEERDRRACIAVACYNNRPAIPDSENCSNVCPL